MAVFFPEFVTISYYIFSVVFFVDCLISYKFKDFLTIGVERHYSIKYLNCIIKIASSLFFLFIANHPLGGRNAWTIVLGYVYCLLFLWSLFKLIQKPEEYLGD